MDGFTNFFNDVGNTFKPLSDSLAPISNTFKASFENMGKFSASITDSLAHLFKNAVSITDPSHLILYVCLGLGGLYLVSTIMSSSRSAPMAFMSGGGGGGPSPYQRFLASGAGCNFFI